ncbi:S-layer homology domain-containing protein [Paenibacillus xylanilyticus]|uniref:S-layer homology domain-containing protein n=1 Tax=Paenibacillus xylanilyticus TaxID=248903 RepID=UPI0039A3A41B
MKKKLLFKVMTTTALLSSSIQPAFASTDLTDIHGSYAKDAILKLAEAGIVSGKGDGKFDPTGKINRQDFAIILVKALGLDVDSAPVKPTFSDIPVDNYSYKYVEAAIKAGLIKGLGNGTFGLGQNLSREDMAVLFARSLSYTAGSDITVGKGSQLTFTDANSIADYAKDSVAVAVELGLINGNGNGTFNPQGNASREQVALVASKFLSAQQKIKEDIANQQSEEQETPAPPSTTPEPTTPVTSGSSNSGSSSGSSGSPAAPTDSLAPTVAIMSSIPVPVGGSVSVTSTEMGSVYLVPFEGIPANVSGLDTLVTEHLAVKGTVTAANSQTLISTEGLAAGIYRAVAVDAAGNVSVPSTASIELVELVENTIQTTSIVFSDASTIVLNYEEKLDPAHKPTASNEDWDTITSDLVVKGLDGDVPYPIPLENEDVTISGNQVIIKLHDPVQVEDSLYISYQPHAEEHALRTLSGKKAQSINEYKIQYTENNESTLSLSLAPNASFVVNASLEVNEPITLSVSPNPENYNKRSIKNLIQVKRGETVENFQYNVEDNDFDIIDAEDHVLGSVSITSSSNALSIAPNGDGLSIIPSNLISEVSTQLVFTLHEEGNDQSKEVTLPVTIDQKKPTVTDVTYDNGKVTLDFDEPISVPFGSVSSPTLEYSSTGDFTAENRVILTGNMLDISSPETDYHYSLVNNQLVILLTDEAFTRYGFASPGRFRVTLNGYQDYAKNNFDQNQWEVSIPAIQD